MSRPAAFLDRDGTLIEDADYLADPALIVLLPGAVDAVRRLRDAGVATVVVTNQSGIARGLLTEDDYERVRERLDEMLASEGAPLDASFHCPHHPDFTGACRCRKPGTLLYERAIGELGLDATRSLFVGDRWRDVAPGLELGGHARLVPSVATPAHDRETAEWLGVLRESLTGAVEEYLRAVGLAE